MTAAMLFEDLFVGLFDDSPSTEFSTFPTSNSAGGNAQMTDIKRVSHSSQLSHFEIEPSRNFDPYSEKSGEIGPGGSRVTSLCVGQVGTVGKVEKHPETLAGSKDYDFPLPSSLVGKKKEEWEETGLPAGYTLIPPATVRAGIERELRSLAEDGRTGPDALRDATAITAAKIRNSEALAERQAHGGRCHVCDEPLDDSAPVVAVMTGKRGYHLHLHAGCCGAHSARMVALVAKIMAAAGYGSEQQGEAA